MLQFAARFRTWNSEVSGTEEGSDCLRTQNWVREVYLGLSCFFDFSSWAFANFHRKKTVSLQNPPCKHHAYHPDIVHTDIAFPQLHCSSRPIFQKGPKHNSQFVNGFCCQPGTLYSLYPEALPVSPNPGTTTVALGFPPRRGEKPRGTG